MRAVFQGISWLLALVHRATARWCQDDCLCHEAGIEDCRENQLWR